MENTIIAGRYQLLERIGSGGMAEVWTAHDSILGRTVAVKVLHQKYANDATFAARFEQEAKAAANLQSPNIVNIYDYGHQNTLYYIVMEYVRGTDLKNLIQSKPYLDSKEVAEIGAQVCAALAVAHRYDIIHRDVKPHNIMVSPDGNVKVMDFGIARAGNTTMTQTGSVLGTAHYVSPEQAQGRHLTNVSDLYSLGVVLYEAATGKVPFEAESPVAVALKQVNEQPIRPTRINPNVDPGLERIIGRAMAKDPRNRYATAEEMRQDLLRVARGQAPTSSAPVIGGVVSPSDATPVMSQTVGSNGAGATTVMPRVESNPTSFSSKGGPQMQPIPEDSNKWWLWLLIAVIIVAGALGVAWGTGLFKGAGTPVPNVVGKTLEEATAEIEAAEMKVGRVDERNDDTIPAGSVIEQSPTASDPAPEDGVINLVVSIGPELLEVPDIVEMTEADARQALIDAGFTPDPQPAESDAKIEAGKIISQMPEAGEMAAKGSAVAFVPSRGIETVQVPNVVGQKSADAKKALSELGFKVTTTEEFSSTVAKGLVVSQNPGAGLKVGKGSRVTLSVSKGPEVVKVEVPDVIGLTVNAAKSTLESLGFKVSFIYEPHSENNTVLEQDPSPGAMLNKGSTVSIIVDMAKP